MGSRAKIREAGKALSGMKDDQAGAPSLPTPRERREKTLIAFIGAASLDPVQTWRIGHPDVRDDGRGQP